MNRWHQFTQLLLSRFREFYREPEAIFGVYGFPVLLEVGLGIAFWNRKPDAAEVDIQSEAKSTEAEELLHALENEHVQAELKSPEECRRRLEIGQTAMYIVPLPENYEYVYDETRTEGREARFQVDAIIQRWKAGDKRWPTTAVLMTEPGSRYIDFLLPGLMGMNLMGGGLWGVGFVLVDMRVRKLLKRLLATPMRRSDFLFSILAPRLLFLLPVMLFLLLVGNLGFKMPMRGTLLT